MIQVLAEDKVSRRRRGRKKKVTTAFLFIVSAGKVLVVKRSSRVRNPGTWGLPGGHIDRGETPKQAALRECREELGSQPPGLKVVKKFKVQRARGRSMIFICEGKPTLGSTWQINLNQEHTGHKWVSMHWLKRSRKLHPALARLLRNPQAFALVASLCEETPP